MRKRGATRLLGWPYFLVDEADDGFLRPNNAGNPRRLATSGLFQTADVALGLDGLVGNAVFRRAEPINIHAFAQMCRSDAPKPEQVIEQYAGFLADAKTTYPGGGPFVENYSNWQNRLPAQFHLKHFDVLQMTSASQGCADTRAGAAPCPAAHSPVRRSSALSRKTKEACRSHCRAGNSGGVAPVRCASWWSISAPR